MPELLILGGSQPSRWAVLGRGPLAPVASVPWLVDVISHIVISYLLAPDNLIRRGPEEGSK